MNSFDNNLKRLRISRNLKQEELAEQMNVTRQTISGWETGRRQPDLDTLKQLAEVLDADIHELIYGDKPGEYPKYQKRYITQTATFGATFMILLLFRLLFLPYFKILCATYYWGTALFICYEVLPSVGAFSFGAVIPSLVQLFVPVHVEKKKAGWLVLGGVMALFPALLFRMGAFTLPTWILYTIGHACITYILPFTSGICVMLGVTAEHV